MVNDKQMTMSNLTLKETFLIVIFTLSIIAFFYPWQIVPFDGALQAVYDFVLHICWIIPLLFGMDRLVIKHKGLKRFVLGIGFLIVFVGLFKATQYFTIGYPMKSTYSVFYSKSDDPNEQVKSIHNHLNAFSSWNEYKHIVKVPKWGFQLEKDFDQDDLSGTWFVHPDNPFCDLEGEVVFINGKSIE